MQAPTKDIILPALENSPLKCLRGFGAPPGGIANIPLTNNAKADQALGICGNFKCEGYKLYFIISVISLICFAQPSQAEGRISQAASAFAEGNYQQAASIYENLLKSGFDSPGLRYNLGNSYYQQQKYGLAIAKLREAQQEKPRDKNIAHNLNLARKNSPAATKPPPPTEVPWLLKLRTLLGQQSLSWALLISYITFWTSVVLKSIPARFTTIATSGTLSAYLLGIYFFTAYDQYGQLSLSSPFKPPQQQAVITTNQAKAFSGTSEETQIIALIPEGTELNLGEQRNQWFQIELGKEKFAWLRQKDFSQIKRN